MNELMKKVGAPALPQVNLLPKELAEKRAMRAMQVTALLVVLIAAGVVVVGYFIALGTKTLAENDLSDARDEQQLALDTRDSKVDVYFEALEREQQEYTLAQVGFGEIFYGNLSAAVLATVDEETSFDQLNFRGPTALGLGSGQDGYYGGGVGTVEFQARASSKEAALELIQRIEAVPGIAKVRGTSEQYVDAQAKVYWQVSGAGIVTSNALTERLIPSDGITGIDPESVAGDGIEPSPAPAPEAAIDESETEEDPDA